MSKRLIKELRFPIIALTTLLFLPGCWETTSGNSGFSVPKYTKPQRQAVHDELRDGCCPMTVEFMKDYKVLRDQVRI